VEFLILFICLGFLYLLFKPSRKLKTKAQKQREIFEKYKQEMNRELSGLDGEDFKKRKMELLKEFANELNRNLFFDENETKKLIQKLIDGK
jgi:predicted Holliday junction resolvase-like endonuclease